VHRDAQPSKTIQQSYTLPSADPVDSGAQSDLIGAHEPMSIEAVLAALGGSRTRGLTPTATFGDGVAVARGGLV